MRSTTTWTAKSVLVQIKDEPAAVAATVYVILRVVDNLKASLAPILLHTIQQLHEYLACGGQLFWTQKVIGYQEETRSYQTLTHDHSGAFGTWTPSQFSSTGCCVSPDLSSGS